MAEFLHQVVKKREREQEMRGLIDFDSWRVNPPIRRGFTVPTLRMPPANEIAYRSSTNNGVTQHSVIFPNVGSWIQCAVVIATVNTVTVRSPQMLAINAWELLAGHGCRPNYTWNNNTYTCNSCSSTYETDGSEWQRG